jgi:hypothetical protein
MELSRFLSYSILVDEIEKIGRLAWSPATQQEQNRNLPQGSGNVRPAFITC